MRTIHTQLGDAYRVYAPGRRSHTWVFNHPDDVRRILISNHRNYTKGVGFDRIKILLGNGIIVSEGEFWKRQRRMMQPTFHRRILAQFDRIIASANDRLLAEWQHKCAAGEAVNVTDDMSKLTLEIVLRVLFGDEDLAALEAEAGENPFAIFTEESERDLKFAYRFRKLAALIGRCVARRRAAGSQPAGDAPDYVSLLLNARDKDTGEGMSDKEIVDELTTLIVAGHETTASALNWTWLLLGEHPEAEAKLHAEIDADPELPVPTLQAMEALPWSNMVIREAMRLYPPVWVVSRRTIEADQLGGSPCHRARTCSSAPISCTVIRSSGAIRRNSCPSASPPRPWTPVPSSPTCPSPPARITASARRWPSTRCWCTSTASRGVSASGASTTPRWNSRR